MNMGLVDNKDIEDEAVTQRLEQLKSLRHELDVEFVKLIGESNLTDLEVISSFTDSVKKKLAGHYKNIFPKKCNTCNKVYNDIKEYKKETEALNLKSTVYDEIGLQEYRNCVCGSTLIVWTKDERRDVTSYGQARRALFDECLKKLIQLSPDKDPKEVEDSLRNVFSKYSE